MADPAPAGRSSMLVALLALAACVAAETRPSAAPGPDIDAAVRDGAITAPDTVTAGWSRLRVIEADGAQHTVALFRLSDDATEDDVRAFAAAFDGASATPARAVALGGPEAGVTGEVIVRLERGRYVVACIRRVDPAHRHASRGETHLVIVVDAPQADAARTATPAPTQDVPMIDFAFVGADRWKAGRHLLRVRNTGKEDHQLRLARLRPGATLGDWMKAESPEEVATHVTGVSRIGAGQEALLPVELTSGEYVAYCLVPDAKGGRPHVTLGMFRQIHVE